MKYLNHVALYHIVAYIMFNFQYSFVYSETVKKSKFIQNDLQPLKDIKTTTTTTKIEPSSAAKSKSDVNSRTNSNVNNKQNSIQIAGICVSSFALALSQIKNWCQGNSNSLLDCGYPPCKSCFYRLYWNNLTNTIDPSATCTQDNISNDHLGRIAGFLSFLTSYGENGVKYQNRGLIYYGYLYDDYPNDIKSITQQIGDFATNPTLNTMLLNNVTDFAKQLNNNKLNVDIVTSLCKDIALGVLNQIQNTTATEPPTYSLNLNPLTFNPNTWQSYVSTSCSNVINSDGSLNSNNGYLCSDSILNSLSTLGNLFFGVLGFLFDTNSCPSTTK